MCMYDLIVVDEVYYIWFDDYLRIEVECYKGKCCMLLLMCFRVCMKA